MQDVFNNEGKV